MAARTLPAVVGLLLVCVCSVLISGSTGKGPKCVPIDWTKTSDFLDFGTCNWPSHESPCGNVVPKAGFKAGQRAWPYGLCSLKFSRKPWNPEVYSWEADKTWHCGASYYFCWQGKNKESGYPCGGDTAGTDTLCPDTSGGDWKCEARNRTYENSNCVGTHDLVLDVSSMGFPPELANLRVSNPEQCAEMCRLRSTCNLWNFCNSPEGCGWTCQGYIWGRHPPKKGLSLGAILGIIATAVLAILTAVGVTIYVCIRKRRQHLRFHHQLTVASSYPPYSPSSDEQSSGTPPPSLPPQAPKTHVVGNGEIKLTRLEIPANPGQSLTPMNSYQLGRYSPRSSPGGAQGSIPSGRVSPARAAAGHPQWTAHGHPISGGNYEELTQQHSLTPSHSHSPYHNQPSPTRQHLFQDGAYSAAVPFGERERGERGQGYGVQAGRNGAQSGTPDSTHISMAILPHTEGTGVIEGGRRQPGLLTRTGRNGADHAMW